MRSRGRWIPVQVPIILPEVFQLDRLNVAIGHAYENRAGQSLARVEGHQTEGRGVAGVRRFHHFLLKQSTIRQLQGYIKHCCLLAFFGRGSEPGHNEVLAR